MGKQKPITPPIEDCWCGEGARVLDSDVHQMMCQVECWANHTLTKDCGSFHRAVCLWNNRVKERKESGVDHG